MPPALTEQQPFHIVGVFVCDPPNRHWSSHSPGFCHCVCVCKTKTKTKTRTKCDTAKLPAISQSRISAAAPTCLLQGPACPARSQGASTINIMMTTMMVLLMMVKTTKTVLLMMVMIKDKGWCNRIISGPPLRQRGARASLQVRSSTESPSFCQGALWANEIGVFFD